MQYIDHVIKNTARIRAESRLVEIIVDILQHKRSTGLQLADPQLQGHVQRFAAVQPLGGHRFRLRKLTGMASHHAVITLLLQLVHKLRLGVRKLSDVAVVTGVGEYGIDARYFYTTAGMNGLADQRETRIIVVDLFVNNRPALLKFIRSNTSRGGLYAVF